MTTFNLLAEPWLPVLRWDGAKSYHSHIAPWQIAESDNPVIALATPRPDFDGALIPVPHARGDEPLVVFLCWRRSCRSPRLWG